MANGNSDTDRLSEDLRFKVSTQMRNDLLRVAARMDRSESEALRHIVRLYLYGQVSVALSDGPTPCPNRDS